MSNIPIDHLPVAIAIDGGERLEVTQGALGGGTSKRLTLSQIAIPAMIGTFATVGQVKSALRIQGKLLQVANAVPAAVEDPINIAFYGNTTCPVAGTLYNFIQTTLSYSGAQMTTLYSLALTQVA